MATIVWTEESLRWLKEIDRYIALDNPTAAAKTLEGIYSKVQCVFHAALDIERFL